MFSRSRALRTGLETHGRKGAHPWWELREGNWRDRRKMRKRASSEKLRG